MWVALALQNMPPKARAPEARMVFGWGQVCGVEICTYSGPSRCLPTVLTMGILQPDIPVRRMASERKTQLTDALVRILRRFLIPAAMFLPGVHVPYYRNCLLALAGHGDGHVLTVTVAMLLAILTGRSDLCIAGVFGAGKADPWRSS